MKMRLKSICCAAAAAVEQCFGRTPDLGRVSSLNFVKADPVGVRSRPDAYSFSRVGAQPRQGACPDLQVLHNHRAGVRSRPGTRPVF